MLAPPDPTTHVDLPAPGYSWRITWRGKTWTDQDLTGQHIATLALISGDDRFEQLAVTEDEVRVYPALGYMRLMNLLRTFVTVDALGGIDDEDEGREIEVKVLRQIQAATAEEIIGSVEFA